jgi:hypothetical protein
MALDRSFVERNREQTTRIHNLAVRLNDDELQHPVGEHWTVAVALAHLAFWDRRVLATLDATESAGKLVAVELNVIVNDISLPLWEAIPPREAASLAIETAAKLDQRLESFPPDLLEQVFDFNQRYVNRYLHRGEHLDEVDAALKA